MRRSPETTSVSLRNLIRGGRNLAFLMTDMLVLAWPATPTSVPSSIILRLDAIGDFFVWLQSGAVGVAQYARRDGQRVILVANAAWATYAQRLGLWDEVIPVDVPRLMRRPAYRWAVLRRLRACRATLLIQPRAARVFLQEEALARLSGAPRRIGNAAPSVNLRGWESRMAARWYESRLEAGGAVQMHELSRNAAFTRELTGQEPRSFDLPGCYPPAPSTPTLVAAIGSSWEGRVWPMQRLAAALRALHQRHPRLVFQVAGGPGDRAAADRLVALCDFPLDDHVGRTSIDGYVELLSRAAVVVCNESSALHIAAALRRPVVAVVGGGHYGWFAPYPPSAAPHARALSVQMDCFGCNWVCRFPRETDGSVRCVNAITEATLVAEVSALLTEASDRQ
jgi:ADP-heptose:LPS heptosyltransferase